MSFRNELNFMNFLNFHAYIGLDCGGRFNIVKKKKILEFLISKLVEFSDVFFSECILD